MRSSTSPSEQVSSSLWTTYWIANGLISKFHLGAFAPSYPFNMFFDMISNMHCAQILSCFGPRVGVWFTIQPAFLAFHLSSPSFSIMLWTRFGLPHFSIISIFQCVSTHPIDATCVHLLRCIHDNEHMNTHDVVRNNFVAIAWNISFHVGREQLHAFPSTMFHSSHWRINIVFTKDGICTLVNVVITNLTWMDLLCQSCPIWRFVAFKVVQAKERNYCDQHPIDHFLPLTIEVFRYLSKQVDVFLHDCTNAMWNFKGPEGPPLFVLVTFFHQKISITLQRMQTSSILSRAIVVGLITSWLPPFQNTLPITTADLLQAVSCWDKKILTFPLC